MVYQHAQCFQVVVVALANFVIGNILSSVLSVIFHKGNIAIILKLQELGLLSRSGSKKDGVWVVKVY